MLQIYFWNFSFQWCSCLFLITTLQHFNDWNSTFIKIYEHLPQVHLSMLSWFEHKICNENFTWNFCVLLHYWVIKIKCKFLQELTAMIWNSMSLSISHQIDRPCNGHMERKKGKVFCGEKKFAWFCSSFSAWLANFHFLKNKIIKKTSSQGRKTILRRVCEIERNFLMINRHFHASWIES